MLPMLKLACRNILRQKRRSLLTALTMCGGFILTAVAIGLSDGTFHGIIDLFTRSRFGHIQIHAAGYVNRPSLDKTIRRTREIGRIVEGVPGIEAWSPRVYSAGLAAVGDLSVGVRIVGLDPGLESRTTSFGRKIVRGRDFSAAGAREIILGAALSESLGASPGDDVVLVSQGSDGSLANDKYRLVGLVETGDIAADRTTAYLGLDDARELFVLEDEVHEIIVVCGALESVSGSNAALRGALASFPVEVRPWPEFARAFFLAMKANEKGHRVLLLVLFLLVAIGVLNTVLMAVLERRREYGVLKALGTRPRRIFGQILLEIQLLALLSVVLGFAFSLPVNLFLSRHGLPVAEFISGAVTFGGMPFTAITSELNSRSFIIPALTVFVSAFLVILFPALQAARTDPAKAMRTF